MRADDGADDVVRVFDRAHPVAHRFVGRVLERFAAAGHLDDVRAHELHAEDVEVLPADVFGAHVDIALQAEQRGGGGGGDAMLARAGFGDHALLAHAQGEQRLADRVVDLVGAGVVEVFALEVDLRAAQFFGQAFGEVNRLGRPTNSFRYVSNCSSNSRIILRPAIFIFELAESEDQRLGDEYSAIRAKMAGGVGEVGCRRRRMGYGTHGFDRSGVGKGRQRRLSQCADVGLCREGMICVDPLYTRYIRR